MQHIAPMKNQRPNRAEFQDPEQALKVERRQNKKANKQAKKRCQVAKRNRMCYRNN